MLLLKSEEDQDTGYQSCREPATQDISFRKRLALPHSRAEKGKICSVWEADGSTLALRLASYVTLGTSRNLSENTAHFMQLLRG